MVFKKLLFNEWFKTFEVLEVSEECFNNSPNLEQCGSFSGIKIKDENHLNFITNELKNKGFEAEDK